ncbi:hypothetical protein [Delftia sp. PS-11]|uniref:hypothetical protein n=1 Tax=Delftia sp. PS-11 TaxID=2767222 RepID=UPI0024579CCF|nr:hypothetical protein [Delftia sp. PS-11]KAJ8738124.1 hypothetical protein H9T68_24395 [Delftia sp. PS-11]
MRLKKCEFEEAEYCGPLFNQLSTSSLLWEPGQVFENHIGIDYALFTTHLYLHKLHGHDFPLNGVVLSQCKLEYIWDNCRSKKKLPSFRLNVFIQAKRPQYGRYAPKALKLKGLKSPYWKFEITPHQQIALEKLQERLNDRAIICYACPVFHKADILHKWTLEPRIVENSTFPDVATLKGHSAWNFSEPGAIGVANIVPTASNSPSLLERVGLLVGQGKSGSGGIFEELQFLSDTIKFTMESVADDATYIRARFFEGIRLLQEVTKELADGGKQQALFAYATIIHFCCLNRTQWLIAGHDE